MVKKHRLPVDSTGVDDGGIMPSRYDNISHVIHITCGVDAACEHCDAWPAHARFDGTVNHYITTHGYRLLHIGSESSARADQIGSSTVAVLGK
jgi:hypothetical protein